MQRTNESTHREHPASYSSDWDTVRVRRRDATSNRDVVGAGRYEEETRARGGRLSFATTPGYGVASIEDRSAPGVRAAPEW